MFPQPHAPEHRATPLQECFVALCVNGVSHAVMLASPFDLEDFALGFALSEGLIPDMESLRDVTVSAQANGWTVDLQLSPRAGQALNQRRRALAGRSGCGLCGVEALSQALPALPRLPWQAPPADAAILRAVAQLPDWQARHRASGGLHAAAYADEQGALLALREDVGRHNALDKLIGHVKRQAVPTGPAPAGFVLLTSRCSYELVMKCARAGLARLVTLALPTDLAVDCAQRANLFLACAQRQRIVHHHLPGA